MSILLDALKRAEQEKQAKQGTGTLETPAPPAPAPVAPKLELEGKPAAAMVAEKPASASREAAKGVFIAKQPAAAPVLSMRLVAFAGLGLLVAAGVAYLWWEWSRLNKPQAQMSSAQGRSPSASPAAPTPAAPAPAAPAPVAGGQPSAPTATGAPGGAAGTAPAAGVPAPAFAPGSPNPAAAATAPPAARAHQPTAEAAIVALLREGGEAQHQPAFRISRSHDAPRIHPDVARGYAALRRGDLAEALRSYEAAQAAEPLNVDVQLGLATIGARSGDRAAADRHYRRALEIDPRNSAALAGLASMADSRAAPDQLEAQLRSDAQRYPQSAALQMALGNLYASQGRWTEAQQVYFDAFRLDPESADASYNLAVSLDHLGQSRVARDYYQRSLAAAQSQAVQFDTTLVRRRVDALRP